MHEPRQRRMKTRQGQNGNFTAEQIYAHADHLTKDYSVILLAAATGSNYVELAKGLGLKSGTVKSRLNRARAALNATIKKESHRQ